MLNKEKTMNIVQKIFEIIKKDKDIAEKLFLFSEFAQDVKIWTGEDEYNNIQWLFSTYQENLALVGVDTRDESIWCIDDEGYFHQDCDELQNLPYEILRIESYYTKNEAVQDYYQKVKGYKEVLERYEQWCKDNNIALDKNKIYHDENGKLFNKSFAKENEQN